MLTVNNPIPTNIIYTWPDGLDFIYIFRSHLKKKPNKIKQFLRFLQKSVIQIGAWGHHFRISSYLSNGSLDWRHEGGS